MRSAPPVCARRSRGAWAIPKNGCSGTRSRACCMIWDGRASTRSCSARSGPGPGRTAFPPGPVNGARSVRELAEVLVACEQFEAYSNRQRGRDYYTRKKESLPEAFAYLDKLRVEGILSPRVVQTVRELAAEGAFDKLLGEARGAALPCWEVWFLRSLKRDG